MPGSNTNTLQAYEKKDAHRLGDWNHWGTIPIQQDRERGDARNGLARMGGEEEAPPSVAHCPQCRYIHGNPADVEAINDWGKCLGCDKLDLIPLEETTPCYE